MPFRMSQRLFTYIIKTQTGHLFRSFYYRNPNFSRKHLLFYRKAQPGVRVSRNDYCFWNYRIYYRFAL